MRRLFDLWRRTARASASHISDSELLNRFVRYGDDSAFAELVSRHGPLVYGTCRRLLPDALDVEDVFQATFLVLVRRAGRLIDQPLGPWLHRVAIWTARNLRRRNAVRLAAVRPLDNAQPHTLVDDSAIDARLDVHQVLLTLPRKYRVPLVLCYLQGLTRSEAAARLGCPESTLSSQLGRGLALLRKRLVGGDVAVLLAVAGSTVVPTGIARATVRSAVLFRTGSLSVAVAPTVAELTRGVLRMFWLRKLASVGVALAAFVAIGAGVWFGSDEGSRAHAQPPSPAAPVEPDKRAQEIERLKSRIHELETQQELEKQVGGTLELVVGSGQRPLEIKELDWRGAILLRIWPTDVAALERFLVRSRGDKNGPRRLVVRVEPSHPEDKVQEIFAACRIAGYEPETALKGRPVVRSSYVIEVPDLLRIEAKILVRGVALSLPREAITGRYIVRPDGTVNLGAHGSVSVTGLTTSAAATAIHTHLLATKEIKDRGIVAETLIVSVVVESTNSKVFFVMVSGGADGESVMRLPWTEDLAIVDVFGDEKVTQLVQRAKEIHIARRTDVNGAPWQVLPVNWKGIRNGDTVTNHAIMPGDRIYLNVKK